jgi:dolichyl-phosphate-mannose--protein O-mannosyl transferase
VTQTLAATGSPAPAPAEPDRPRRIDRLRALSVTEAFWGWAGPLLITLVGGVARFWHLDRPHKMIFDETYYVKEGASYLKYGVEMSLRASLDPNDKTRDETANKLFTHGNLDIWSSTEPDRVVHPPVGKWMIAFGEWLFGPTSSWGWRFSCALVGTLSILILGRIAYRLFGGSALLGSVAALLLAVDGLEFVHSRTGILDIFVMFWALAAFACLLIDRDKNRARLLAGASSTGASSTGTSSTGASSTGTASGWRFGPWTGVRWWRLAGIVCLGLDTGVKWSGIYFAAAFLTLSVAWDLSARRAAGVRHWFLGGVLRDGVQAFVSTVVVLPAVYLATWTSWFLSDIGWNRHGEHNPDGARLTWLPDALRNLWYYHADTWAFHLSLTSPHDWQANPWAWMVLGRPTLFFFDTYTDGHGGCHVDTCRQMITALGNPLIWWAGTLAVFVLAFRWLLSRDWRAGAALIGIIGGYLPWFMYQKRTIFEFYAVAFVPWVVLAVTYCLGLMLGPTGAGFLRRRRGAIAVSIYVFSAVMMFWYFYPVLAARIVPQFGINLRDWLHSWY